MTGCDFAESAKRRGGVSDDSHRGRQHQPARAEVEVVLAGGGAVGGGEAVEAAHALFDDFGLFEDADVLGGVGDVLNG